MFKKIIEEYGTEIKVFSLFATTFGCVFVAIKFWKKYNKKTHFKKKSASEEHNKYQNLLVESAASGNVELVQKLLKVGVNVDEFSSIDNLMVFRKMQIDDTISSRLSGIKKMTAIEIAALTGNVRVIRELLPLSVKSQTQVEMPLLILAVIGGHMSMIIYLVEECLVDLNITDKKGFTPLHEAVASDRINIVSYLILHGCFVNPRSFEEDIIPLMFAKSSEVCELLISYGANIFSRTKKGFSCTIIYSLFNFYESLEVLLRHAANSLLYDEVTMLNVTEFYCFARDGEIALWIASSRGFSKVVEILLNYSVDVNSPHPITRDTPLQLADRKSVV